MLLATARLAHGAAVEAAIKDAAVAIVPPGARAKALKPAVERRLARLHADALLVATWTSAHAAYVLAVQSGIEEPPAPSLFSVPSALTELDVSDLFARRACTKLATSKPVTAMLNLVMRCTNPGARGWDSLLAATLSECAALRIVISNAMLVSLTGMHAFLHPAARPPWALRMRTLAAASQVLQGNDASKALVTCAAAIKETVRRMLAASLVAARAMHTALSALQHPVGLMTAPPLALPHAGQEAAMVALAWAGVTMLSKMAKETPTAALVEGIKEAFRRPTTPARPCMAWDAPWLGARARCMRHATLSTMAVRAHRQGHAVGEPKDFGRLARRRRLLGRLPRALYAALDARALS
jgi:hypothetical protein